MNKEKRLANLSFAFFAAISLICMVLPAGVLARVAKAVSYYLFTPFVYESHNAAGKVENLPRTAALLLQIEDENRQLRRENREAKIVRAQIESLLEENRRLGDMVGLSPEKQWKGVWGRVIERDRSRWMSSLTVDRGYVDGVSKQAPVLAVSTDGVTAALAGTVVDVERNSSRVMLISDEMSAVTAYIESKGLDCLVEGRGRQTVRLSYIPLDANVDVGARVFTSPTSAVFPPGILIGRIIRAYQREGTSVFLSAEVEPYVNIGGLKELFIVTGLQKGRTGGQK